MFIIAIVGSFVFITNIELTLLILSGIKDIDKLIIAGYTLHLTHFKGASPPLLAIISSVGSTIGSSVFYWIGFKSLNISSKYKEKIESFNFEKFKKSTIPIIFFSCISSIPPVTIVTLISGIMRYSYLNYFVTSLLGKSVRYLILVYAFENVKRFIF